MVGAVDLDQRDFSSTLFKVERVLLHLRERTRLANYRGIDAVTRTSQGNRSGNHPDC
jgi:hypothetical protein